MAHPPLDQAQVLRRRLEETTRDLAAARAGFDQTADRDLLDRWPKDEAGAPEPAAKLDIQWELDSQADITVSFLESCGIPAFQNGSLGKVLGGFASQGVEIWVPASQLEEAQALLNTPAEIPEQD